MPPSGLLLGTAAALQVRPKASSIATPFFCMPRWANRSSPIGPAHRMVPPSSTDWHDGLTVRHASASDASHGPGARKQRTVGIHLRTTARHLPAVKALRAEDEAR